METDGPRRSGRTTRRIDEIIQTLFTKGEVHVSDHFVSPSLHVTARADKMVMRRVVKRLESEHGARINNFEINVPKLTIKLKNPKT